MKICFASLRKKINYTDVLEYGMDVFYECFRYYKDNNKEHDFTYYNFAWGSKGAERDISALKHADIVVFPAVQEFIYFADAMHPRDVEKSQAEIRKTYEHLNDKHIILLTQDRGVNEEMVMQYTFEKQVKPKSFQTIDEMDFTKIGNIDLLVISVISFSVPMLGNVILILFLSKVRNLISSPKSIGRINVISGSSLILVGLIIALN